MIHTIIESNVLLYVMAAMGALSVLGQLMLNGCYRKLIREIANTQAEKGEFMKKLRYRYQNDRKRSGGNVNIPVFVKQTLMNYRYRKLTFHQWKRGIAGLFAGSLLIGAAGIGAAWGNVQLETSIRFLIQEMAAMTGIMAVVVLWTDLGYKSGRLQTNLEDYLCHSGIGTNLEEVVLEESTVKEKKVPAVVGIRKKAEKRAESKAQKEKRELQENLVRMKDAAREVAADDEVSRKKERNREILRQMDAAEQERIIRDVLAEFLA